MPSVQNSNTQDKLQWNKVIRKCWTDHKPGRSKSRGQPGSCSGRLHIRGAYTSGITGNTGLVHSRFAHAKELLRKLFAIWERTLKMFASPVLGRKSLVNISLTGAELWPARASPDHCWILLTCRSQQTNHLTTKAPSQTLMVLITMKNTV
jgi:hypothetical protein